MGEMGTYQLFTDGGAPIGGMFNKPAQVPVPCWLFYFNAGPVDAAADRVRNAGGQIINGPMEVPGENWILQSLDPRGAMFALLWTKGAYGTRTDRVRPGHGKVRTHFIELAVFHGPPPTS